MTGPKRSPGQSGIGICVRSPKAQRRPAAPKQRPAPACDHLCCTRGLGVDLLGDPFDHCVRRLRFRHLGLARPTSPVAVPAVVPDQVLAPVGHAVEQHLQPLGSGHDLKDSSGANLRASLQGGRRVPRTTRAKFLFRVACSLDRYTVTPRTASTAANTPAGRPAKPTPNSTRCRAGAKARAPTTRSTHSCVGTRAEHGEQRVRPL